MAARVRPVPASITGHMASPSPSPALSTVAPPGIPPSAPSIDRALTGAILGDRYELRALIGRGGMGEVYEAADPVLDRTVAVKVLRAELATDRRSAARFEREARTAARLSHPRIVAVFDAGRHDDRVFIVMEHVAGATLVESMQRSGALDAAAAASIGAGVAEALAHAHERGVVHRDVTPGNVMLDRDGRAKVLDFGIARVAKGTPSSTSIHGTIAYAAPEVLAGDHGDQRVDVYGLGAVLYELVTGGPPFRGGDAAIERRLRVRRPVPLRGWIPDAPRELDDLVRQLLAFDPSERPADLVAVARSLREIAASPTSASTGLVAIVPPPTGTAAIGTERPAGSAVPRTARLDAPSDRGPADAREDEPRAEPARRRWPARLGRAAAWVALIASIVGAGAIVVPSVIGATTPVRPSVEPPAQLPAPADLVVTASCDGWLATGVDITWSHVAGASGYEIWRRGSGDEGFVHVGTMAADVTGARDPDLGIDRSYTYRVRATDGQAVGTWSKAGTAQTPLFCLT